MKREKIITLASALLILSLIFGYIGYSFGKNLFEPEYDSYVGIDLTVFSLGTTCKT